MVEVPSKAHINDAPAISNQPAPAADEAVHHKYFDFQGNRIQLLLATVIFIMAAALGASIFLPAEAIMRALAPRSTELVDVRVSANNRFGFDVFSKLLKGKVDQNILISPLSINMALSMTSGGASGATKDQLLRNLGLLNISGHAIASGHGSLLQSLRTGNGEAALMIANSIWADKYTPIKQSFIDGNQAVYDAEIKSADFRNPGIVDEINSWVSRKTHERIPVIVNELKEDVKLLVLNAVYFKATWSEPFKVDDTIDRDFTMLTGSTKETPMMWASRDVPYLKGDGFQAVKLSYGTDGRFELWIFLPDVKPTSTPLLSLANAALYEKFLGRITARDWDTISQSFERQSVKLVIPRFRLEMEKSLKEDLKDLGIKDAFDERKANLGEMFELGPDDKAWIDDICHKTFIEVDEKGTEAAAATVIPGVNICGTVTPLATKEFIADHPFVLGIRDSKTGALLFLGSVADPS